MEYGGVTVDQILYTCNIGHEQGEVRKDWGKAVTVPL